ncbi:hypothetical protein LTR22_026834 [Elasticomyces elasticus]|nr:hypothetical protein LTR22_026834 [Elasticomyces elasticus]
MQASYSQRSTPHTLRRPTPTTIMGLVERFYDPTISRPYDESKPSHTTYTTIVGSWSDDELEDNHEYIQWLFPIPECSRRQHEEAPPLDPETRDTFHARQELRDRMHRAWKRMMPFYGWNVVNAWDTESAAAVPCPGNHKDR